MARRYEFDDQYTPEQAYAVPQFRRGVYDQAGSGGSMAQGDQPRAAAAVTVEAQGAPTGLRAGEIMGNMRQAAADVAEPNREGFKASQDAGSAFADSSTALSESQADAMGTAMAGTNQALLDRSQGRAELQSYMNRELMSIQAANEQKADSRRRGGGVVGAIGSIVGGLVGGPVGAGIGALGGLFG